MIIMDDVWGVCEIHGIVKLGWDSLPEALGLQLLHPLVEAVDELHLGQQLRLEVRQQPRLCLLLLLGAGPFRPQPRQ